MKSLINRIFLRAILGKDDVVKQINGGNIETKHSEATITYQIKSVAELPSCIGYKEEYDFFLKMKQSQIKQYMDCVGLKVSMLYRMTFIN